ncbi:metallophosphoesterase [Planctomycetota bacterium]
MPQTIIDLLKKGMEANHADKFRRHNVVNLPADGDLILTGDLHGHRRNFEKIVSFADLDGHPDRHILLQEVIHGGPEDAYGGCLSYRLLYDVVRYKLSYPDRIHVIMGNHDTAYINNSEVMKDGREMNRAMHSAMEREFPGVVADVELATKQFLFSQPLAVRCENRIWASHSLPADRLIEQFDPEVFHRQLKVNDIVRPGSAYLLTWGRKHSQALLDHMARLLNCNIFILGHQPQEQGWGRAGKNLIILDSNRNHGCLLPIDLAQSYTVEQLVASIVLLASVP